MHTGLAGLRMSGVGFAVGRALEGGFVAHPFITTNAVRIASFSVFMMRARTGEHCFEVFTIPTSFLLGFVRTVLAFTPATTGRVSD